MTLGGILLGLINICIVIAILVLVGAIVMWVASLLSYPIPANVQKAFLAVVALIALYMLVALLLGIPTIHIITTAASGSPASAFCGVGGCQVPV